MNSVVLTTIITTLGVIIVALIGIQTSRLANKSAIAQTKVEEKAKYIEGYEKLNASLEKRNEVLDNDMESLRAEIKELYEKQREDRAAIRHLEEEKDTHRAAIRVIIDYCNLLVQILNQHNISVPAQPQEIARYLTEWPKEDPG